jgi:predicted Rossmann fold flavoprotein
VVVVGAGAAGLMAAIFAAGEGMPVILIESTSEGGRKILISGGGRCNILPSTLSPGQYITASSPHTLKKMLLSWPLAEQRSYFEDDLGIPLELEAESGKLFPASNRARDVRDGLVRRAVELGVELRFGWTMKELGVQGDGGWLVRSETDEYRARCLVLATGGLSVPQTGSDGRGLALLRGLGHRVNPLYPALTPLTADPPVHAELAGISLQATLYAPPPGGPMRTSGGFLFTHRGYSGPAVLDISHLAVNAPSASAQPIHVRWAGLSDEDWGDALSGAGGGRVSSIVRQKLPTRLADLLIRESGLEGDRPLAQLRRAERSRLMEILTRYPLPWTGNEGYKKAEVTGGGVDLGEVRPDSLESRIHPRLFLCGEVLDAFGPIGGYNFAWAWATGRVAGRGAALAARRKQEAE